VIGMSHPINVQTSTSYRLSSTDATEPETFVLMNSTHPNTVTVPVNVLSAGALINIIQIGPARPPSRAAP